MDAEASGNPAAVTKMPAPQMPPPLARSGSLNLRRQAAVQNSGLALKPKQVQKTKLERDHSFVLRSESKLVNRRTHTKGTLNEYTKVEDGVVWTGNEAAGVRKYEKDGILYAVKSFENARHGSKRSAQPSLSLVNTAHSEREEILREADIMFRLDHPNVVHLVEVIDDSHSDSNPEAGVDDDKMHIVMEYVEGGSLQERIENNSPIAVHDLRHWFVGAAKGLTYLHEQGVLHLDMKPANMMICNKAAGVKICDFGTATWGYTMKLAKKGTPLFQAPELAKSRTNRPANAEDGQAADVWSLGASFYYAALWGRCFSDVRDVNTALHPGSEADPLEANFELEECLKADENAGLSGLIEVVQLMLDEKEKRVGMQALLANPFVNEFEIDKEAPCMLGAGMSLVPGAVWVGDTPLPKSVTAASPPSGPEPHPASPSLTEGGIQPDEFEGVMVEDDAPIRRWSSYNEDVQ